MNTPERQQPADASSSAFVRLWGRLIVLTSLVIATVMLIVVAVDWRVGEPGTSQTSSGPPAGAGSKSHTVRPPADGAALFAAKCAVCHGPQGKGDGPAAARLDPRPRDFTRGLFKLGTTVPGDMPSDADLARVISRGLYWSAMHPVIKQADVQPLVQEVKRLSTETLPNGERVNHFAEGRARPYEVPPRPVETPGLLALGARGFQNLCATCHGPGGHGDGPSAKTLVDAWGHPDHPRNLSIPVYKGGSSTTDIFMRITRGIPGTPMPSFAAIGVRERWAIAAYVKSLQRWPPGFVARGKVLFHALGCASCHGQNARGGIPDPNYVKRGTPNLSTLADQLGIYSRKDAKTFTALLEAGDVDQAKAPKIPQWVVVRAHYDAIRNVIAGGSPAGEENVKSSTKPFSMPSWGHRVTGQDANAIIAYLVSLNDWSAGDEDDSGG